MRKCIWIVFSAVGLAVSGSSSWAAPADEPGAFIDAKKLKPAGKHYEATVPDTLDLAELAKLSVNDMTGNLEPAESYCVYQVCEHGDKPSSGGLTWNLPAKNARALPWLRTMSGSEQGLDIEANLMKALLKQVRPDGLAYVPVKNDGAPKDTAYPYANGLIVLAALNWYERDKNPKWLEYARTVAGGLEKIAIRVEDRAYYPPECSYKPDGTWHWTLRGEAKIPYHPPEEPYLEQQGLEGCVKYENAAPLRALVKAYGIDHDAKYKELADKVAKFALKDGMWEDGTTTEGYKGSEHGIFAGHYHGNTTSLHALLELGIAESNESLKQIAREAYDHGRRTGVTRMGWFPGWLKPLSHNRPEILFLMSETCGVSDMLLLAVKLSDAGMGDYWDDVDSIVRNHLIAQQITSVEEFKKTSPPGDKFDAVYKRFVGGFGQGLVNETDPHVYGCCSANGAIGLYYAWHGITRFDNGVAKVNLFLNRASDWMDIDSYLPFEGKVVLHNKKAHTALVRIPYWVDRAKLTVTVGGKKVKPPIAGNQLVISDLKPGDITLEFPVEETTEKHTIGKKEYTLKFRGSTLVDIGPRSGDKKKYQYYMRDNLKGTKAPMRKADRFVAENVLPLQ